ncbi:LicD family protein [Xylanimonas ulmi]|uniref:Lipopolysaccharide cholinephosphotransferase n=1 Tax=Xylanimonas ulmi TaxID=228973 RepID=A0A4Q7LXY8_9MICO|nr:LicD family protein [Xylanibacterium ulmi]RZS59966.1 lipopolysaccharide cholinephosphotransferase [Xylanibacterium ulmi]
MPDRRLVGEDELRAIQVDILETIDRICREHGIEYTIAFGTLLGAIRHGGYIPWDDDIDIELTRDGYERLIALLATELPEHLSLLHRSARPTYLPFAKVYDNRTEFTSRLDMMNRGTGVFVDIFPVDAVPDDADERQRFHQSIIKASTHLAASNDHGVDYSSASRMAYRLAKLVLWLPAHLRHRGQWRRLAADADLLMQRFNTEQTTECGFLGMLTVPVVVPRSLYAQYEDVLFEGRTLRKLVDHDTYLRRQYGDYMELPPQGQRVNHSYYRWFWKPGYRE